MEKKVDQGFAALNATLEKLSIKFDGRIIMLERELELTKEQLATVTEQGIRHRTDLNNFRERLAVLESRVNKN